MKRHDYLPFGEELFAPISGRSAAQGYSGGDGVRQQFTSKERDVETGLDYFGARYYASTQGRFTGTDPLLSSGRLEDPQTWNRYSYTLNNPLCLLDPTGMFTISSSVKDQTDRDKIIEAYNKLNEALTKLKPGSKAYKSIERSLARLGKPGEANGVVVTIGKLSSQHTGGETDPRRIDKGIVTITLNSDNFSTRSTEEVASTLGHEGVHADDDFNLWAKTGSMSAFSKIYNSNAFVYQTEYDAFFASAGVYQALLPESVSTWGRYEIPAAPGKARNLLERYDLWNPSWKTLDLKQIEAKQSETIQTKLEASRSSSMRGYGLRRPRNFQP
jgi:RHS repeat-associated protein